MKKTIIIGYYLLLVAFGLFSILSLRWMHYKSNPKLFSESEEVTIPIDSVVNPTADYEYYYTVMRSGVVRASTFPFISTKITKTTRDPVNPYYYRLRKASSCFCESSSH